jgi:hypothetical protein
MTQAHRLYVTFVAVAGMVATGLAATVSRAAAEPFTLTPINVSGAVSVAPQSINASGQVVGSYQNAVGVNLGFLDSAGVTTSINVAPSGFDTDAVSINDSGTIAGFFLINRSGNSSGFTQSSTGVVTKFTVPTSFKASDTSPVAINAGGVVVGNYIVKTGGAFNGFLDTGGTFTSFVGPGARQTIPTAINAAGEVVGFYVDAGGNATGFTLIGSTITALSSAIFEPTAINNSGAITGIAADGNGFLDVGGVVTEFTPSATATSVNPTGIDAAGEIVGFYTDSANVEHGFVDDAGVMSTLDVAGAAGTEISGINAGGTIIGYSFDANHNNSGFIGTQETPVPEPGSVVVLLTALASLGLVRASRARG